jgi:hypothetical protein
MLAVGREMGNIGRAMEAENGHRAKGEDMSVKDGLLACGVAVAIILSAFALLSRPGDARDEITPAPDRLATIQPALEGKLAEGESRARSLEDKLGRIEERVTRLESRKPPATAARDTPQAAAIEVPEAIREWEPDDGAAEVKARGRAALSRGLVGWWKFDDRAGSIARDSSGKGHNGRLLGRPKWTKGRLGGALEFDGIDDSVVLAGRAPAGFMHDSFRELSICFWVRQNAAAKAGNIYDEGGMTTGIAIRLGADGLRVAFGSFDVRTYLPTIRQPSLRTWHHVAVTFKRGSLKAFIDGRQTASARAPFTEIARHNDDGGLGACARSDIFGRDWQRGHDLRGVHFTGLLDDFRIYNRALAPEEVEALATGKATAAPRPPPEDEEIF